MKQCKCGSFAFNLAQEGVDQRGLCDRHYWQDRAEKADVLIEMCERALKTSKVWHSIALHKMNVYPDCTKSLAAIAARRGEPGHHQQSPDASAYVENSGILGAAEKESK